MRKIKGLEGVSFGVMEGLIMITGMLIGFGLSYPDKRVILLAVLTAAVADAFANSVAFHVSEETKKGVTHEHALKAAGFCFVATFFATVVPVVPVLFFPIWLGVIIGGAAALVLMAFLSVFVARMSGREPLSAILEYVSFGAVAAALCYGAGHLIAILL